MSPHLFTVDVRLYGTETTTMGSEINRGWDSLDGILNQQGGLLCVLDERVTRYHTLLFHSWRGIFPRHSFSEVYVLVKCI